MRRIAFLLCVLPFLASSPLLLLDARAQTIAQSCFAYERNRDQYLLKNYCNRHIIVRWRDYGYCQPNPCAQRLGPHMQGGVTRRFGEAGYWVEFDD